MSRVVVVLFSKECCYGAFRDMKANTIKTVFEKVIKHP